MNALEALLSYDIAPLQVSKDCKGQIQVEYSGSYIKDSPVLIGAYGCGSTFNDACEDYLNKINGKKMVFELLGGGRKEITVNFVDYKEEKQNDLWDMGNLLIDVGTALNFFKEDKMTVEEAIKIVDPMVVNSSSTDKKMDHWKDLKARILVVNYARDKLKQENATDKKEDKQNA